jgi:hypothetical protein
MVGQSEKPESSEAGSYTNHNGDAKLSRNNYTEVNQWPSTSPRSLLRL